MPRIPLKSIVEGLSTEGLTDENDEMVIIDCTTYFMVVDGEVNVVFGLNPLATFEGTKSELIKALRRTKIPKVWQ